MRVVEGSLWLNRTLRELRRRHVYRVMGSYAIAVWLVLQVADVVLPALMAPDWLMAGLVLLAVLGAPLTAVLAWVYDLTPGGVVRTDDVESDSAPAFRWNWRWLDYLIIAGLLVILAFMVMVRAPLGSRVELGRSIAVLPFADLSAEKQAGYFSDGMTEAIIDGLARIEGLQVASRTSSFAFRDIETDARQLAQTLGVSTLVEGSVRRSDDRIRIIVRLVDGATGHQVWNETYDSGVADIFALQDSISRAIAGVLKVQLLGEQILVERATLDDLAYDDYLRGRDSLRMEATVETSLAAIEHFDRALARDADFSLARAGLCTAHWQHYEQSRDPSHAERAITLCEQARLKDPDRVETRIALGNLLRGTGDASAAAAEFEQVIAAQPGNSEAHVGLGRALQAMGRMDTAKEQVRRGIALDPAYWRNYSYLGALLFAEADYRGAAEQFERAIRLEPNSPRSYSNLGGALFFTGDFAGAADAFRRSLERQPTAIGFSNVGTAFYFDRRFAEAEIMFRAAVAYSPQDFRFHANLADALSMQPEKAIDAPALYRRAIGLARQRLNINPSDHDARASMALYLLRIGEQDDARSELRRLAEVDSPDMTTHLAIGEANLLLGRRDDALIHFEQAVQGGWPRVLLASAPRLVELREDPRFLALTSRSD